MAYTYCHDGTRTHNYRCVNQVINSQACYFLATDIERLLDNIHTKWNSYYFIFYHGFQPYFEG